MPTEQVHTRQPSHHEPSALASNVMAAISMADVIRTTLGPKGLDKLLVDQLGNRVITNDGYTVLVSLKTSHPVSKLLVEIAEQQEINVGDGTTSTVIMAAEMLREGFRVISEYSIHPSRLLAELDEGADIVTQYLQNLRVPIDSLNNPLMQKVLKTTTASKLDGEQLSRLILKSVTLLGEKDRNDLRHGIILLRRLGDDLFLNGIAIEHLPEELSCMGDIGTPKVTLIKNSLKFPLPGSPVLDDNERHDKERTALLAQLAVHGINVVITNAPEIDPVLKMELFSKKIGLIRVSTEELGLLSRALSTPIIYGAQIVSGAQIPSFTSASMEIEEDKGLTMFNVPQSGVVATLIIGGSTVETSKERMRTCVDGISGVHFALKGGVVPGGGIAELNSARFLEKSMIEQGSQKVGYNLLIKGLESITRQILDNSGYNGYDMTVKLKSKPDGIGLNMDTGDFISMVDEGIVDPLITKIHAIRIATHITKTVLKIDRNLLKDEVFKESSIS